jgi:signal transduction histidine kinase
MGSLAFGDLLQWASAAVYLAIAVVAARRVAEVPLARPLVFFAGGLFAYVLVEQSTPGDETTFLNGLENGIASLIFIPAVELLLGFAGRRQELKRFRYAAYAYYAVLALFCLSPFYDKHRWEPLMFAGLVLFFGYAALVLVRHYLRSNQLERVRTMLLLGALLLGGVGTASTLLHDEYQTPDLVDAGMAASGVLLAALFFRTKLLRGTTNLAVVTAAVFAAIVVVGEIVLYSLGAQTPAVFIAGSVVIVLLAFAALRPVFGAIGTERARAEHLATLGRLSQQMAHDLKNPLAAIVGAAEFLEEEHEQGRSLDESTEFIELILEQAKRIEGVIDEYRRLARVEPVLSTVRLGELVRKIVEAQSLATHARSVEVCAEVAGDVGEAQADPELITTALENLVRNASEAISESEQGSRIVLGATRTQGRITLSVEDDGPGMDARTRERALGEFFTTKTEGSGLGLPFAKRVAEAHGGELVLEAGEGAGTSVRLVLPAS